MTRRQAAAVAVALVLACAGSSGAFAVPAAQSPALPTRVIVLKVDGLPQAAADAYVNRIDARTGRSELPWMRYLFYEGGVRVANFYSRGISLSEPAWAIVDTGQHSIIKGNFEVDRHTGDSADHLSFVGFNFDVIKKRRLYPAGVEALDACRVPLVSDAFAFEERETGMQLLRRGSRFYELLKVGLGPFRGGSMVERAGDLLVGLNYHKVWAEVIERKFVEAVRNPTIRYADLYWPYIDEAIHDDNSDAGILAALKEFDGVLGRTQQAIADSGAADRTVLVVVSDHGATYDGEGRYSQGIRLTSYLEQPAFGAHHAMLRGGPLAAYSVAGSMLRPLTRGPATTVARQSLYLGDRPQQITCALDYDGNERAQLHFRDPDLNRLQMLWRAAKRGQLDAARREAVCRAAVGILDCRRPAWSREADEVAEEVAALGRLIAARQQEARTLAASLVSLKPADARTGSAAPALAGESRRLSAINSLDRYTDALERSKEVTVEVNRYTRLRDEYGLYRDRLRLRTSIRSPESFRAASEDALFGDRDFGASLTASDLTAYPIRLRDVVLDASGALDARASFETVNYFDAFAAINIRNSVRSELGTRPVAWSVARLDVVHVAEAFGDAWTQVGGSNAVTDAFLVFGNADRQLVMLYRPGPDDAPEVELVPIMGFAADPAGRLSFTRASWQPGLPFGLVEDGGLDTGGVERLAWLSGFHSTREWFEAAHRTAMGLSVAGLTEVYAASYRRFLTDAIAAAADADDRLLLRLERRRRDGVATDLFLHASPHWNFDLKDFNAGGNHGGLGRSSMHAVLWMRGGPATGIVPGPVRVDRPYDGLDVAPTLLEAAGLASGGQPTDALRRLGFRTFPGRVVVEAFRPPP